MGSPTDAINRLKQNKELRTKYNPYLSSKNTTPSPSNKKYLFKTPTFEEIEKLKTSNQFFLAQQKRRNLIAVIFGMVVGISLLYWFSGTELWKGYIEGFGKYAR